MKKFVFISAIAILLGSCTKTGEPGPQGPQGPQGLQGPASNANVQSFTYNLTSSNWGWSGSYWYVDFNAPSLTSSIANSGAVMVYRLSGSDWYALPRVQNSGSTTLSERFIFSTGSLRVLWQYGDGGSYSSPGTRTFRVVLINGYGKAAHPGLNYNDYNEVKKVFNLKE